MNLQGRKLLNSTDFSTEEISSLISLGEKIVKNPYDYSQKCSGRIMGSLFFEPSTRTKLSFDSAMKRLGGEVVGFTNPQLTSSAKGESVGDTVRTVACYADLLVMRHPQAHFPHKMSEKVEKSFINAGDGANQHPTQTLTDIFTIHLHKKRTSGLTIGLCGDLKYGRTIHSLIETMDRYEDNTFICVSNDNLRLPQEYKDKIKSKIIEVNNIEDVIEDLDVLYMTRVQAERFESKEEYEKNKDGCILTKAKLENAKSDMIIMHPLPRVNEITEDVDSDKRAVYFKQAEAGMYIRMALIMKLLGVS